MLRNSPIRNVEGDFARRWISDDFFDLIVWYAGDGTMYGFQLCYDKSGDERAITWTRERKLTHSCVDPGDEKPTANRTPMLRPGGTFDRKRVLAEFLERSSELDPAIREFVLTKLNEKESLPKS
jgi:hypothetical protein